VTLIWLSGKQAIEIEGGWNWLRIVANDRFCIGGIEVSDSDKSV
jgi:hypothetical protein